MPERQTTERSPTWWEGYWANAAGWPLYEGHTSQYVAGWRHREAAINGKR